MKIVKESIDRFYDYDLHVETRTIVINDEDDESGVGPKMAEKVIKAFVIFDGTPEKEVRVILNSKGGDWDHGMAIYDTIKASPCRVTVEVRGSAMSMAVVILQAGDERIVHPNATIMVHDGQIGMEGHTRDVERWSEWSKNTVRPKMYEIFAERSEKPNHYWAKKCAHDYILTAEQAVEEGLADKVFGHEEEKEE